MLIRKQLSFSHECIRKWKMEGAMEDYKTTLTQTTEYTEIGSVKVGRKTKGN